MTTQPIVSTAKIRGAIKRNNIQYVDRIASMRPSTHQGITVWQLGSCVMIEAFGFNQEERIEANLNKFIEAIAPLGLTINKSTSHAYEVVAVA